MTNYAELPDAFSERPRGNESVWRWLEPLYADLKRMAHRRLSGNVARNEFDTTGLVHESILRLLERGPLCAVDRAALLGYVARVMRSVVIDHVRATSALKRGGPVLTVTLPTGIEDKVCDDERVLAMNEALVKLEQLAPDLHRLVELRYFAGLSLSELAELNGTSRRTQEREWAKARAFLRKLMNEAATTTAQGHSRTG